MPHPDNSTVIGVDLGGTKILSALIRNGVLSDAYKVKVPKNGTEEEVLDALYETLDVHMSHPVSAIGIGVPSVVDITKGIVYDVQNIPSWKEVALKSILENKYDIPVYLNNDANCFAIGEKHFGHGQEYDNFVAMIVGTGMAAGIIINQKLYNGRNCGAGEFGIMAYKDRFYEYYCAGQFFNNVYGLDGEVVYKRALEGDRESIKMFHELGTHIGEAIKAILYAVDPELIIMGGSVSKTHELFEENMWKSIEKIVYRSVFRNLKIAYSSDPNIPVLGAGALCYEPVTINA